MKIAFLSQRFQSIVSIILLKYLICQYIIKILRFPQTSVTEAETFMTSLDTKSRFVLNVSVHIKYLSSVMLTILWKCWLRNAIFTDAWASNFCIWMQIMSSKSDMQILLYLFYKNCFILNYNRVDMKNQITESSIFKHRIMNKIKGLRDPITCNNWITDIVVFWFTPYISILFYFTCIMLLYRISVNSYWRTCNDIGYFCL